MDLKNINDNECIKWLIKNCNRVRQPRQLLPSQQVNKICFPEKAFLKYKEGLIQKYDGLTFKEKITRCLEEYKNI